MNIGHTQSHFQESNLFTSKDEMLTHVVVSQIKTASILR